jgi:N-acetylglucosaminyldiphosphoundecaprenol N-acetyl-beta-D-mannosaminyltransferase
MKRSSFAFSEPSARERAAGDDSRTEPAAAASSHRWPVAMLGVPFDNLGVSSAIARMETMIATRHPHYVVTANVDFLVQSLRDIELQRILLEADLVLCDGTPLVWASRLLGNPLPERVAGSDVVPLLIHTAAERGYRVFFLGAGAGVAGAAAERLQARYPTLKIVGHYSPPFNRLLEMDHDEIVQRVREAKPDILLVSFGCPKQEKWLNMHFRTLDVPVAVGVGATLDFLAGRIKRAPQWMRQSGTEWLYRLWLEPRRLFRRYATDVVYFLPALAAQWWRLRPRRIAGVRGEEPAMFVAQRRFRVWAGRQLDAAALSREAVFWREAMSTPNHCLLDLSQVRSVDSTGIALLVRWRKQLLSHGCKLVLLAPSREARRALRSQRLEDHFLIALDPDEQKHLFEGKPVPELPVQLLNHGVPRLGWQGEVTAANVEDVWRLSTELLGTLRASQSALIVDLTGLRFIDSSGVGLMLRLSKWARTEGVKLSFTGAQRNVENVLQLAQLDRVLLTRP